MGVLNFLKTSHHQRLAAACALVFGIGMFAEARAEDITMAIYPIFAPAQVKRAYQPLADYLGRKSGQKVVLLTSVNQLAHWQLVRREQPALILEGPHMVDYRVKKMNYTLLAKLPGVVSFSLVAHKAHMVVDPVELIGKPLVTMQSPSLGALRLDEFFPNTVRQPMVMEVDDVEQAMDRVTQGKAVGALIPSSMVERYADVITVATTEQAPAPAITVAPRLDAATRNALRQALLDAHKEPAGIAALKALNLPNFEAAESKQFDGYARLLENTWGY